MIEETIVIFLRLMLIQPLRSCFLLEKQLQPLRINYNIIFIAKLNIRCQKHKTMCLTGHYHKRFWERKKQDLQLQVLIKKRFESNMPPHCFGKFVCSEAQKLTCKYVYAK